MYHNNKDKYMSIVQFRWVNPETNNVHIIDQFNTDWRFNIGDVFNFFGGDNKVQDVKIVLSNEQDNDLCVTQLVTILPMWEDSLSIIGITPEKMWEDKPCVGIFD